MKMKNVVIVAGLGLVGIYAAKKLIDRRNRKANDNAVEENVNEEINEEVEQPECTVEDPEEYERRKVAAIPVEERICPDYIYEEFLGKELNDKIKAGVVGVVEFKRPKLKNVIWIGLYALNIAFENWGAVKCMIGLDLIGIMCRLIVKLVNKNENK